MRALHFIVSFFPHDRGASHSALRLARGLRTSGVEVEFVVEDQGPEWRTGGQHEGFPVQSFPVNHPGKQRKICGFYNLRRFVMRKKGRIDVIHIHGGDYMNLLLARLVARWLKAPVVMKITSDGWDTPDGVRAGRHGWLALQWYRKLDAVVAMTSGQADKCRAWKIPGLVEVIPNGVDTNHFRPASNLEKSELRSTLGLPAHSPIMVYGGWLGHGKGTDVLFKVWYELRQRFPELRLLLAGNYMGHENMAMPLREFLKKNNLPDSWADDPHVITAGKTPDLAPYLRASDLFVFPSRREGFGTVQIEAMACGLPCLVNDLPGVSVDIFPDDSCGRRIMNNDVAAYVEAGEALLNNPALARAMGACARDRAVKEFSSDHVAKRYVDLYRRLTGAPAHSKT